ncbi:MAG: hypothetical protein NTZ09_04075 [Candidatus Hydrogenedentes bacterium]|nr:hypothetical protein [Candidatus Hydrogenedentota bacterium]
MGGIGSITTSGGMFIVDGQAMDLGQLMMQINIDRTEIIDTQLADQMADAQEKNAQLRALNELMAQCRQFKANESNANDDNAGGAAFTLPGYEDKGAMQINEWFAEFGMTETDVNPGDSKEEWEAEWDANIQTIKGAIDSLNSDSQLAMVRLQSLMNKRNQSYETVSDVLQKDQKTRDTIVGNLR